MANARQFMAARTAAWSGGKALPYDAEVEFIESTGTQRIATGVRPIDLLVDGRSSITFDFESAYSNTGTRQLNGIQGCWYAGPINGMWQIANGGALYRGIKFAQPYVFTHAKIKFLLNATNIVESRDYDGNIFVEVDGVNYGSFIVSGNVGGGNFSPRYGGGDGLCVFSLNDQILPSSCKISFFKIYSFEDIVFDFTPVRFTNERGVSEGAMYDKSGVGGMNPDGSPRNDGLYRNRGTGAFIIGPDKT